MAKVIINAYFSGTNQRVSEKDYFMHYLANADQGKDLSPPKSGKPLTNGNKENAYKFAFDGVQFSAPPSNILTKIFRVIVGTIFGYGMEQHCRDVDKKVRELIAQGHDVTVNSYGLSRGGEEAKMLVNMVRDIPKTKLTTNFVLVDPVPGNSIWVTKLLDFFGWNRANRGIDLRGSENLNKVLCLYTHEVINPLAFHAPTVATYPEGCIVEEEVVRGCHSGAAQLNIDSLIPAFRCKKFMEDCGAEFNDMSKTTIAGIPFSIGKETNATVLKAYQETYAKPHWRNFVYVDLLETDNDAYKKCLRWRWLAKPLPIVINRNNRYEVHEFINNQWIVSKIENTGNVLNNFFCNKEEFTLEKQMNFLNAFSIKNGNKRLDEEIYNLLNFSEENKTTTRYTHSEQHIQIEARLGKNNQMQYLNKYHKYYATNNAEHDDEQRKQALADIDENDCRLVMRKGFFYGLRKRAREFAERHPYITSTVKWLLIGAAAVGIIYLTGGLALIPAIIIKALGAYVIPTLIPLVSLALSMIWDVLKPLRDSIAERSSLASTQESLWRKFVNFFKGSGISHLFKPTEAPHLLGREITDDLNFLGHVIEGKKGIMPHIRRSSFVTGIIDTFKVFTGDHYDYALTGQGRKGLLDVLLFPVVARRLIGFAANPKRHPITRLLAGLIGGLLEIPRIVLAVALTVAVSPIVGIVHAATKKTADALKGRALEVQVEKFDGDENKFSSKPETLGTLTNNKLEGIEEVDPVAMENMIENKKENNSNEKNEDNDKRNIEIEDQPIQYKEYKFYREKNKTVYFRIPKVEDNNKDKEQKAFDDLNVGYKKPSLYNSSSENAE